MWHTLNRNVEKEDLSTAGSTSEPMRPALPFGTADLRRHREVIVAAIRASPNMSCAQLARDLSDHFKASVPEERLRLYCKKEGLWGQGYKCTITLVGAIR